MSKWSRKAAIPVVLAAFLVAPIATAQDTIQNPDESTPTTLYFHIFDTVNKFVINTQPMDAEFFEVGGANFPTFPGTGAPPPIETGVNLEEGYDMNTVYGYSTAGPVEYDFIENGKPRFHPERGIAQTVQIDSSVTPVAYVYLDVRDATGGYAQSVMPDFTVRITVQEGDDPGLNANLDEGKDIMTGEMNVHLLQIDGSVDGGVVCGALCCDPSYIDCQVFNTIGEPLENVYVPIEGGNDAASGQTVGDTLLLTPDENGIVEVAIPLDVLQDTIPKKEAYNVRLDWYQLDDAFGEDGFNQGWIRLASDPDHLSRLELNIMNPVYFSFIHPQVAGGTLLIHAGGNSPWGTYDVDLDAVTISVSHESGAVVPDNQLKKLLNSNEHVHGLHDQDAQLTYLWDFRDNNAELGEYTIDMSITNDAGNSKATGQAKFIVTETEAIGVDTQGEVVEPSAQEEVVDTPAVGALPILAFIGAALVATRRRLNA